MSIDPERRRTLLANIEQYPIASAFLAVDEQTGIQVLHVVCNGSEGIESITLEELQLLYDLGKLPAEVSVLLGEHRIIHLVGR
jgi:hypothetical protein